MKTLTEFAGVILRQAAQVRDERAAEGLQDDALAEAVARDLSIGDDRARRLLEALQVAGKGKLDSVRLVRVYQGEDAPPRAVEFGDFRYVVDRIGKVRSPRADDDGRKPSRKGRSPRGEGRGGPRGRSARPGPNGGPGPSDRPGAPKDRRPARGRPDGGGPGRGQGRSRSGPPGRGRGRRDGEGRGGGEGRGRGGEKLPSSGAGWSLTRAPREEGGRRGRGGPRRGARGDRERRPDERREGAGPEQSERRPGRSRQPRRPPRAADVPAPPAEATTTEARPPEAAPKRPRPEATASSPDGLVQRRPSTRPDRKPGKRRSRRGRRHEGATDGNQAPAPAATQEAAGQPDPGNQASAELREPNGNVALPPPTDVDDSFGNR